MIKILLIEDDANIANLLKIRLTKRGYDVQIASSRSCALKVLESSSFDLLLLDRMLPDGEGTEICKSLKTKILKHTPIIFVTAMTRPEDIVAGLNAGADDYVTKPFDMNVLMARISTVLRRYQVFDRPENRFQFEHLLVDIEKRFVEVDGHEIKLTKSEFNILSFLLANGQKVVSREQLMAFVQGESVHVSERTIDTHIAGLRKKLDVGAMYIETIRGIGYRITNV